MINGIVEFLLTINCLHLPLGYNLDVVPLIRFSSWCATSACLDTNNCKYLRLSVFYALNSQQSELVGIPFHSNGWYGRSCTRIFFTPDFFHPLNIYCSGNVLCKEKDYR